MGVSVSNSHGYALHVAWWVICTPHHHNFCCLPCKPLLLESMVSQTLWEHSPNPLGTPPKPFGTPSQSHWGTFPKPLGYSPKAIGAPSQRLWEGYWSTMWGCESKEARLISSNKECNISAKDGTLNSKRSFGLKLSTVFNTIMRTVLLQQKKQTITRLFLYPGFIFTMVYH